MKHKMQSIFIIIYIFNQNMSVLTNGVTHSLLDIAGRQFFALFQDQTMNILTSKKFKNFRSSSLKMFHKLGVQRKFAKFTEKHLFRCIFIEWRPLINKETLAHSLFCGFCEIFKNILFMIKLMLMMN